MFKQGIKITVFVSMVVILNFSGAAVASSHNVAWTFSNVGALSYGFSAVIAGQNDNFEDGTLQGWSSGAGYDNIATGGPAGAGDNYLTVYRPTETQPYPFHQKHLQLEGHQIT